MRTIARTRVITRGGQIVPYVIWGNWHQNFAPLRNNPADCGANAFYLLGYCNWHTANYLADLTHWGLHWEIALLIINDAYPQIQHRFEQINDLDQIRDHFDDHNIDTLAFITTANHESHWFIIFIGDHILAIDPQHYRQQPLDEFLNDLRATSLHILNSDIIIDGNNRVTQEIIDQHLTL